MHTIQLPDCTECVSVTLRSQPRACVKSYIWDRTAGVPPGAQPGRNSNVHARVRPLIRNLSDRVRPFDLRPPLFSIHAFTQNTKACTINFRTEPEPRSHLAPSWRAQLLRRGKESDSENAPRVCVPFRAAQCAERCATASTLHTHAQ